MGTTMEDIQYEEAFNELHFEAVMKNEARKQCIYIFVEGESEEVAFQSLLEDCGVSFEADGVVIANYNGIGNLKHALRLMSKTLSHDRPIIVTFDDDLNGKQLIKKIQSPLITLFRVPFEPVVTYKDNQKGGSFEECFSPTTFVEACFKPQCVDERMLGKEGEFRRIFDLAKPWVPQLTEFIASNGGNPKSINKVAIAENMAASESPPPRTFIELAKLIKQLRAKFPVKNPSDVEVKF